MRVIFLGKKPAAAKALEYLVGKGITVTAVVAPTDEKESYWRLKLVDTAERFGVPLATDEELYACMEDPQNPPRPELAGATADIDLVISFLFWKRLKKPLIDLGRLGCINFHPAPLPDFRGVNPYNIAILEGLSSWGVSAHFVEETFDTGPMIETRRFNFDAERETVLSLERLSQRHLLNLFKEVMDKILAHQELPRVKQGEGRYCSKEQFEASRIVLPSDPPDVVRRKIRAFWFPPHHGAAITIGGEEFTLVDETILKDIARHIHDDVEV